MGDVLLDPIWHLQLKSSLSDAESLCGKIYIKQGPHMSFLSALTLDFKQDSNVYGIKMKQNHSKTPFSSTL